MLKYRPRAFACYPRRGLPEVAAVLALLDRAGLDVWRDADDLSPGAPWRESIARAIRRADAMIVFLGADGPTSEQAVEIQVASVAAVPMFPVLLSDYEPPSPPSPLGDLQYLDLRPGLGRPVAALAAAIGETAAVKE